MYQALTVCQLAQIIDCHHEPFALIAARPRIEVSDIAYAVSKLAVDSDAARHVVALSTGQPLDEVPGGLITMLQAAAISAQTIAAHPPETIANIFIRAVVPGFGDETGTVQ